MAIGVLGQGVAIKTSILLHIFLPNFQMSGNEKEAETEMHVYTHMS